MFTYTRNVAISFENDVLKTTRSHIVFLSHLISCDISHFSSCFDCKQSFADFAKCSLLKDCKKLAEIPSKGLSVHYATGKAMLITIVEENLTFSGEICDLLLQLCTPQDVVTLTIRPKFEYKSENIASIRNAITFLRAIDGDISYVEPLEAPNLIVGVAAGSKLKECYA